MPLIYYFVSVLFLFLGKASLRPQNINSEYLTEEFVNSINSMKTSWKAGHNSFPFSIFYRYSGSAYLDGFNTNPTITDSWSEFSKLPVISTIESNLPTEFDARIQWPFCPTINKISDQGSCGSCWAVSAVDTMSDRMCIHSKGKRNVRLSAANLINCCWQCGFGCFGGIDKTAWNYWVKVGIVSGESYDSGEGCQPYQFQPCGRNDLNCTISEFPQPSCSRTCQSSHKIPYKKDLHFGKSAYSVASNEEAIKTEIYRNGPVQSFMRMYSDLFVYKSGVYQHVKGDTMYGHAIRIIGWGVDNTTRIPYWLAANSFNEEWGENGFFKIKRGTNECFVEDSVTAGIPLYQDNTFLEKS